jgi:DNA-binding protein HU-beta
MAKKTMTKADLVDKLAVAAGCSKKAAGEGIDAVLATITAALVKGDAVQITGFGTFDTSKRKKRTARNPRTGEAITIAATTVPRFRPGATLKAKVAGK